MSLSVDENNPPNIVMENEKEVSSNGPLKSRMSPPVKEAPAALSAAKKVVKDGMSVKLSTTNESTPNTVANEEPIEDFLVMKTKQEVTTSSTDEDLLLLNGGGTGGSLQDSFKRFRKQKVKERRIMQMCKEELTTKGPRTQEFKDKLFSLLREYDVETEIMHGNGMETLNFFSYSKYDENGNITVESIDLELAPVILN